MQDGTHSLSSPEPLPSLQLPLRMPSPSFLPPTSSRATSHVFLLLCLAKLSCIVLLNVRHFARVQASERSHLGTDSLGPGPSHGFKTPASCDGRVCPELLSRCGRLSSLEHRSANSCASERKTCKRVTRCPVCSCASTAPNSLSLTQMRGQVVAVERIFGKR